MWGITKMFKAIFYFILNWSSLLFFGTYVLLSIYLFTQYSIIVWIFAVCLLAIPFFFLLLYNEPAGFAVLEHAIFGYYDAIGVAVNRDSQTYVMWEKFKRLSEHHGDWRQRWIKNYIRGRQ